MANLEENQRIIVASFTDAWIETGVTIRADQIELSHLLQMRGLKLTIYDKSGAKRASHLLQMRGLKRAFQQRHTGTSLSHLLQMRGLKPCE